MDIQDQHQAEKMAEGGNTELLAVRVPTELMAALQSVAKQNNKSVPEMVRRYLTFNLYPAILEVALRKLKSGESEAFESIMPGIPTYRAQLKHLITRCDGAETIKQIALKTEERFAALENEALHEWLRFLEAASADTSESDEIEPTTEIAQ